MNTKQEKKILSLRKKGMSIKAIAKETGVGEHSVSKFLKEAHETKDETPAAKPKAKKSVNGTDTERIPLPNDADDADDGIRCSVAISVVYPEFLDSCEKVAIEKATKYITKALKKFITTFIEDHGYECDDISDECDDDELDD